MKLDIKPANIITNRGKELAMLEGKEAIEVMRLRTILIGLKAEAQGMRLTRHVNCTQLARELTGLKTRDRAKLAERVQVLMDQQIAKCIIVEESES